MQYVDHVLEARRVHCPIGRNGLVYSGPERSRARPPGAAQLHPGRRGPLWKVEREERGRLKLDHIQAGDQLKVADVGGPDSVAEFQGARSNQQIR